MEFLRPRPLTVAPPGPHAPLCPFAPHHWRLWTRPQRAKEIHARRRATEARLTFDTMFFLLVALGQANYRFFMVMPADYAQRYRGWTPAQVIADICTVYGQLSYKAVLKRQTSKTADTSVCPFFFPIPVGSGILEIMLMEALQTEWATRRESRGLEITIDDAIDAARWSHLRGVRCGSCDVQYRQTFPIGCIYFNRMWKTPHTIVVRDYYSPNMWNGVVNVYDAQKPFRLIASRVVQNTTWAQFPTGHILTSRFVSAIISRLAIMISVNINSVPHSVKERACAAMSDVGHKVTVRVLQECLAHCPTMSCEHHNSHLVAYSHYQKALRTNVLSPNTKLKEVQSVDPLPEGTVTITRGFAPSNNIGDKYSVTVADEEGILRNASKQSAPHQSRASNYTQVLTPVGDLAPACTMWHADEINFYSTARMNDSDISQQQAQMSFIDPVIGRNEGNGVKKNVCMTSAVHISSIFTALPQEILEQEVLFKKYAVDVIVHKHFTNTNRGGGHRDRSIRPMSKRTTATAIYHRHGRYRAEGAKRGPSCRYPVTNGRVVRPGKGKIFAKQRGGVLSIESEWVEICPAVPMMDGKQQDEDAPHGGDFQLILYAENKLFTLIATAKLTPTCRGRRLRQHALPCTGEESNSYLIKTSSPSTKLRVKRAVLTSVRSRCSEWKAAGHAFEFTEHINQVHPSLLILNINRSLDRPFYTHITNFEHGRRVKPTDDVRVEYYSTRELLMHRTASSSHRLHEYRKDSVPAHVAANAPIMSSQFDYSPFFTNCHQPKLTNSIKLNTSRSCHSIELPPAIPDYEDTPTSVRAGDERHAPLRFDPPGDASTHTRRVLMLRTMPSFYTQVCEPPALHAQRTGLITEATPDAPAYMSPRFVRPHLEGAERCLIAYTNARHNVADARSMSAHTERDGRFDQYKYETLTYRQIYSGNLADHNPVQFVMRRGQLLHTKGDKFFENLLHRGQSKPIFVVKRTIGNCTMIPNATLKDEHLTECDPKGSGYGPNVQAFGVRINNVPNDRYVHDYYATVYKNTVFVQVIVKNYIKFTKGHKLLTEKEKGVITHVTCDDQTPAYYLARPPMHAADVRSWPTCSCSVEELGIDFLRKLPQVWDAYTPSTFTLQSRADWVKCPTCVLCNERNSGIILRPMFTATNDFARLIACNYAGSYVYTDELFTYVSSRIDASLRSKKVPRNTRKKIMDTVCAPVDPHVFMAPNTFLMVQTVLAPVLSMPQVNHELLHAVADPADGRLVIGEGVVTIRHGHAASRHRPDIQTRGTNIDCCKSSKSDPDGPRNQNGPMAVPAKPFKTAHAEISVGPIAQQQPHYDSISRKRSATRDKAVVHLVGEKQKGVFVYDTVCSDGTVSCESGDEEPLACTDTGVRRRVSQTHRRSWHTVELRTTSQDGVVVATMATGKDTVANVDAIVGIGEIKVK